MLPKSQVKKIAIENVKVGHRSRDAGPIDDLAASIAEVGLLNPITVTTDLQLVAGLHRLLACKSLKWKRIPAVVVALDQVRQEVAELDENLIRNELSVLERGDLLLRRKHLHEALHPDTRKGIAGGKASGRVRIGNQASRDNVTFAQDVAGKVRRSRRTIEREVEIAVRLTPEAKKLLRGGPLADKKMDLLMLARLPKKEQLAIAKVVAAGKATGFKRARLVALSETVTRVRTLPTGRYDAIVVDPPWPGDTTVPYPTMTVAEITDLPIPALAADDCLLWLWTTNATIRHALSCIDAWGFREKSMATWVKNMWSTGTFLRGRTEHCILATRGKPRVLVTDQTTVIEGPARQHSRKPEEFYTLVESLCPGPKVELFARVRREGWDCWGGEVDTFDAGAPYKSYGTVQGQNQRQSKQT